MANQQITQDEYGPEWRKMVYGAAIPRVVVPEPEITQKAARDLLTALKELELRTRHFISGELVSFPAALLPQVRALIERVERMPE